MFMIRKNQVVETTNGFSVIQNYIIGRGQKISGDFAVILDKFNSSTGDCFTDFIVMQFYIGQFWSDIRWICV